MSLIEFLSPAIPHRAVAARIENGVEILLINAVEANGLAKLGLCGIVFFETAGELLSIVACIFDGASEENGKDQPFIVSGAPTTSSAPFRAGA
jgi:hypothetical protein